MGVEHVFIGIPEEDLINAPGEYPSMESPWFYHGWYIWRWTGWKGNWCRRNPLSDYNTPICKECGKAIEIWDLVYVCQSYDGVFHAECKPEYKGMIAGQWLAMDTTPGVVNPDTRFAYASAPGEQGLYRKGDCFDIGIDVVEYTYYTDVDTLEEAKAEAFGRLKAVIDHNGGVGWNEVKFLSPIYYVKEMPVDANL